MRTIWKYNLSLQDDNVLDMPIDATVVHVADQNDRLCIWVAVDAENERRSYHFYIRGTGHPVPDDAHYIASWQRMPFVWHLFEKR